MSIATVLVSELVRAANTTNRLSELQVRSLLEQSIIMVKRLRRKTNIVPIAGRDALIYIRTVAAGADRLPSTEWQHALLHAAEMVRDLCVVLDSGTLVNIKHLET